MKREAFTTILLFIWLLLVSRLVQAATLVEFMGPYDPGLIYWAAGLSVVGGWLRTIMSLQGDDRYVMEKFTESLWDTLKALISGLFTFFVIQALRSAGYLVPSEVRFGAVVVAGWSRMSAVYWITDIIKNIARSKIPPSIYVAGEKPKDTN